MDLDNCKLISALENIYICPSEICNLHCHYCYTKKNKNILSSDQILNFISRYQSYLKSCSRQFLADFQPGNGPNGGQKFDDKASRIFLKSILFCGGEVFLLPWFVPLINNLLSQGIFISIITNGTIDKLDQIIDPSNCQLLVSFDGPQKVHDSNRGPGNFNKSLNFAKKARLLGFPVEIFFLITKESYPYKDSFNVLDLPKTYLTDRLGSLTSNQVMDIKKNYPTYPAPDFGCFQLALQSDGKIYGCCESGKPLASLSDPIDQIIASFLGSLGPCFSCPKFNSPSLRGVHDAAISPPLYLVDRHALRARDDAKNIISPKHPKGPAACHGCTDPSFLCGYRQQLRLPSCQSVFSAFSPK